MGGPGGGPLDYVKGLWNAVTGNAQQPAAPAATPAASGAAAAPAAAGDTTGPQYGNLPIPKQTFIDNPWVQGALATYLGAIGSPRREGLGGAISHGGLAGLSAYQTARENLYKPYLLGAQIAHTQAQTAELGTKTGLEAAKTKQITGIAEGNATQAAQLRAAMPGMTPEQRQRAEMIANVTATDTSRTWKFEDSLKAVYGEPTEELKNLLAAKKTQFDISAGEQKLPGELGKQQAEIQRDLASATKAMDDASLTPDRKAELQQRVAYLKQQNETLQKYGGVKPRLTWMFDQQGRPQQVLAGPGYEPPPGLTPIRPPNAPKTPQGIINQKKISDAYTARYGTWGAMMPGTESIDDFARRNGIDWDTGQPIAGGAAGSYPGAFQGPVPQGGQGPGPAPPTGGAGTIPSAVQQKYQAKGYVISPDMTRVYVPGKGWATYDPTTPDEED